MRTKTRDQAVGEFAEAMWGKCFTLSESSLGTDIAYWTPTTEDPPSGLLRMPASARPLHEHLEFVGRVAEHFPDVDVKMTIFRLSGFAHTVALGRFAGTADDVSWAVVLAATAARKGKP